MKMEHSQTIWFCRDSFLGPCLFWKDIIALLVCLKYYSFYVNIKLLFWILWIWTFMPKWRKLHVNDIFFSFGHLDFYMVQSNSLVLTWGFKYSSISTSNHVFQNINAKISLAHHAQSLIHSWNSLALISIDGHLHSPLIHLVDVRLSPSFCLLHNHHILFHL